SGQPDVRERLLRVLLAHPSLAAAPDLLAGHRVQPLSRDRGRYAVAPARGALHRRRAQLVADGVLAPSLALSLRSEVEARAAHVLAPSRRASRLAERQAEARLPARDLDPARVPLLVDLHDGLRGDAALRRLCGHRDRLSLVRHDPLLRAPL